ncbi:MAG: ComEC/Rec2 family competence protein [Flavobacteriales bacterium]|nr:ComEC/Rec2 family competence protein [Flavobacteriales bacterium]
MKASFRDTVTRAPMIRLALCFLGGVMLGSFIDVDLIVSGSVALLMFLGWCALTYWERSFERRWWRGVSLMPSLFVFGIFWYQLRTSDHGDRHIAAARADANGWRLDVVEVISESERTVRIWADANAVLDSSGARAVNGKMLLTLLKDSSSIIPSVGDDLLVLARADTIERVADPGGFDQRTWAASYGVYHQCFAPAGKWRVFKKQRGWTAMFEGSRQRITQWLRNSSLGARERGMVKAILLGIRDELDTDQKSAFVRSGTMHVLAVSGSHVALIYGVLLFGFSRFGETRKARLIRSLVILLVLWFYAGLTGATPSVLRATVTFTLFCFSDMIGRRTEPVNSLASAAFLLVLWDPLMIWQLSFQLSFLAVLGIAMFYTPLMNLWAPPNVVFRYFWSLFSVSLAAQSFTTPLALYAFKAFPVWFLPANLIIVGLVALGVYGGAVLLLVHRVPFLGEWITWLMQGLLKAIGVISDGFAHLPGAYPAVRIDAWQCAGSYLLVLLVAGWFFERWHWARTGTIALIIALLISWGWNAHDRNSEQRFVIYDERDHLACAVESGRTLTVFVDTVDQWTSRKITQHQRSMGAVRVDTVVGIPGRIKVGNFHAMIVEANTLLPDSGSGVIPTVLVLNTEGRYDIALLNERFHPADGFVIGPAIKAKSRAFFRRWCREHEVPCHDVRLGGAYVR